MDTNRTQHSKWRAAFSTTHTPAVKTFCLVLLLCFSLEQFVAGDPGLIPLAGEMPSAQETRIPDSSEDRESLPDSDVSATSTDFLIENSALSPAGSEVAEALPSEPSGNYECERYDFKDAVDLLRPEYATAAVIKDLTAEDLKALTRLDFEVGIAVLEGELVLFSSGNRDEISVSSPALELLEHASLVAHTHPSQGLNGPSGADHLYSGIATEYVLTASQTFAYDCTGLQAVRDGYDAFLSAVEEVLGEDSGDDRSSVLARHPLNQFTRDMDLFNETRRTDSTTFRSDGLTFTLEAEQMQASGWTWNGGTFVSVWGDGKLTVDYNFTESGIYEIEILAMGDDKQNPVVPQLRLSVDGAVVQEAFDISKNDWQFASYPMNGIELTSGMHRLEIGAFRTAGAQSIGIDKIRVRKVGEIPYERSRVVKEAEAMTATGGAWNGGTYVTLWGGGKISNQYPIDESGIYEVEVYAVAQMYGLTERPDMKVTVDGVMAGE
ncbi:MAG: hypothetical protein WCU74_09525, partial [Candidatus Omnitrophota bacterium]